MAFGIKVSRPGKVMEFLFYCMSSQGKVMEFWKNRDYLEFLLKK